MCVKGFGRQTGWQEIYRKVKAKVRNNISHNLEEEEEGYKKLNGRDLGQNR